MQRVLFSVFFILIPILSIAALTVVKVTLQEKNIWDSIELSFPIIIFYYIGLSIMWLLMFNKIKKTTTTY